MLHDGVAADLVLGGGVSEYQTALPGQELIFSCAAWKEHVGYAGVADAESQDIVARVGAGGPRHFVIEYGLLDLGHQIGR